jgi:hypothetical protein
VETIRSPYIIASHWHTEYGSLAHLRKPGTSELPSARPIRDVPQRAEQPFTRSPATTRAPVRPRRRTRRRVTAAVAASLVLFTLFGVVPELLGDRPYNPWGKDSRSAQTNVHQQKQALPDLSSTAAS